MYGLCGTWLIVQWILCILYYRSLLTMYVVQCRPYNVCRTLYSVYQRYLNAYYMHELIIFIIHYTKSFTLAYVSII